MIVWRIIRTVPCYIVYEQFLQMNCFRFRLFGVFLCLCYGQSICLPGFVFLCFVLVVSTSAISCLERLVSEMTFYVSSGTLNPTHSLTVVLPVS